MIFDNRRISEITDQELITLIGNQEENLWIDFKQKDYHKDPTDVETHKRETCKDVTAMANAEGGYILIGVREEKKVAHDFFTVDDAANVARSINGVCLQNIDPRIPNLEVEPYSIKWRNRDINLVIIHIPSSEMRPHSFIWKGTTNFVKRYNDVTREFPISELIQDLLIRYQPPIVGRIDNQLDVIARDIHANRRHSMSSEDDPLEQVEVRDLLHLMKLRFDEFISNQPYYRILAVPTELDPNAVNTRNDNIRSILQNPPNIRYAGFGVTGMMEKDMISYAEGIKGRDMSGGEIILLKNGFLEIRCPLSNSHFQWKRDESRISTEWLYPYAVCELPVSFLKLVKGIFEASAINSRILIQQVYCNLEGFMLPKGNPSKVGFTIIQDEGSVYRHLHPIDLKRTLSPNFVPDHVAYDLVKEVYEHFGLDERWIPAFDEEGNFILE